MEMEKDSTSAPDSFHEALGEALRELDEGASLADVEARYLGRYPSRASEVRDVLAMRALGRLVAGNGNGNGNALDMPVRLGDCRIRAILAQGGMGTIYDAEQEPLGRRVAVKVIRGGRRSPVAEARFLREQVVLARLHHTNIVPIHAAGVGNDLRYFVMQYIPGASGGDLIHSVWEHASSQGETDTPSLAQFARSVEHHRPADHALAAANDDTVSRPDTEDQPAAGPSAVPDPIRLSRTYYRSVAKVIAEAADAIEHAHAKGIHHRDVKPSNLMIDANEHCWVLDFGLASYRASEAEPHARADLPPEPEGSTTGVLGTYPYMSPEHLDGRADALSDVWGLGVTLYEFLCLRRAFPDNDRKALETAIRQGSPASIERLAPGVPRDLAAIARKATNKAPASRYPSAAALRDDLRNWLDGRPVKARPAYALRQGWLWSRRHPWGAGAVFMIATLLIGLAGTGFQLARAANRREAARIREIELLQLREDRDAGRHDWHTQWQERLRRLVLENGQDREFLAALRNEAAEGLARFHLTHRLIRDLGVRSLAYDSRGRLLMGGAFDPKDHEKRLPSRIWDGDPTSEPRLFPSSSIGPVGFLQDGRPIQWTQRDGALALLDLEADRTLQTIRLPGRIAPDLRGVVMTPDGSRVAAIVASADQPDPVPDLLVVWDGSNGRELRRLTGAFRSAAITPDGAFLAFGDDGGQVSVLSVDDGRTIAIAPVGRSSISAVGFGRNPHLGHSPDKPRPPPFRWQLAVGEYGGRVLVWDLGTDPPTLRSSGSIPEGNGTGAATSLTFSPDGSMLAISCHGHQAIWDAATGVPISILCWTHEDAPHAYHPDGTRFAIGGFNDFSPDANVWINEVADGRVARSLFGLRSSIHEVVFSPDEQRVAALANDWRIGVWERATGRLLALLDAPPGLYIDNAAIAVSPDNRRVAFSSHVSARMWEIDTGAVLRDWKLPIGLSDKLHFDGPDRLLLARAEAVGGAQPYNSRVSDPSRHPRYCALYDLLAQDGDAPRPFREIKDLDRATHRVWIAPDGRHLLLDGIRSDVDAAGRPIAIRSARIFALDRPGPPLIFAVRTDPNASNYTLFDPTGSLLALHHADSDRNNGPLLDYIALPGGQRWNAPGNLVRLGPLGRIGAMGLSNGRTAFFLAGRAEFLLDVDPYSPLRPHRFTRDGRYTAGIAGGRPTVLDLHGLDEQLRELGLGW